MRARRVRPAFWTDSKTARLPDDVRLFYIGLWCVADDAGYIDWDLSQLTAELMPYRAPDERESLAHNAADALIAAGRVEMLSCGRHARIPTLERHRIGGGTKTEAIKKVHLDCQSGRVRTSTDMSVSSSLSSSHSLSPSSTDLDAYKAEVAEKTKRRLGVVS
jgi:hypothetical protein